jgi:hypothetical protein
MLKVLRRMVRYEPLRAVLIALTLALLWLGATVAEWVGGRRVLPWNPYGFCGASAPAVLPRTVRVGLYTARWRAECGRIRADVFEKGWSEQLGAFKQSYEDERLDASNLLLPLVGFIEGSDPRMTRTIDATIEGLVSHDLCYRYLAAPEGCGWRQAASFDTA